MVNKGQIHGESSDFLDTFWNLIKLDDELWWEIRDFDKIGKITQNRIHGIKNHWIWIKIHGEIDKRIREKFFNAEILKYEIKYKIN